MQQSAPTYVLTNPSPSHDDLEGDAPAIPAAAPPRQSFWDRLLRRSSRAPRPPLSPRSPAPHCVIDIPCSPRDSWTNYPLGHARTDARAARGAR